MPDLKSFDASERMLHGGAGLRDDFKDLYWGGVKRVLREVFGADDRLAESLRDKVDETPTDTQLVFYDAEPFAIAADIANARYLDR